VPDPGLFGPDSVTWRIHREDALLLGGGRALIMQVAHPLVAAGVGEHSRYREDRGGASTERSTSTRASSSAATPRPTMRVGACGRFTAGCTA
jgi:uncharacterized protein (DUF2236 family)